MKQLLWLITLLGLFGRPVFACPETPIAEEERHAIHFETAREMLDWLTRMFPSCPVDAPEITLEYLQGLDLHWSEETFRDLVDLALDDTSRYALSLRGGGFGIVLLFADPLWSRYPWEGHAYLREQLLDWHERRGWPPPAETEMGYLLRAIVTREDFERMLSFLNNENGGSPPSFHFYQLALNGGPAHGVTEDDIDRLMKAWEGRRSRGLDRQDRYDQAALWRVNSFRVDQAIADVRAATDPEARAAAVQNLLNTMREMVESANHWDEMYRPRHPWIQDDLKRWYREWIENPPETLIHEPELHKYVLRLRLEEWLKEDPDLVRASYHRVLRRADVGDAPAFVRGVGSFIRRKPDPSDREPLNAAIRTLQEWGEDPENEIQRTLESLLAAQQALHELYGEDPEEASMVPALNPEDMQRAETEADILFAGYREEVLLEREARRNRPCSLNLQSIARVKQDYSWFKRLPDGHILTAEDVADIHGSFHYGLPRCPQGGEYTIGAIGEPPSCSIHGPWEDKALATKPTPEAVALNPPPPYRMDPYLVTKGLWDEVRNDPATENSGYSDLPVGGGQGVDHPVHTVSWFDAVKWLNARSERAGREPVYYLDEAYTQVFRSGSGGGWPDPYWEVYVKATANGYRLPTAEQWEYAARGGLENKRFPWGDRIDHSKANYKGGSSGFEYDDVRRDRLFGVYHPKGLETGATPHTTPVDFFEPNKYGLYDMAGNLMEWNYDWHPAWRGTQRVLRGGGWSGGAAHCRIAVRNKASPCSARNNMGFRALRPSGQ